MSTHDMIKDAIYLKKLAFLLSAKDTISGKNVGYGHE